jgi:uncharacterized protein YxeA
MKKRLIWLLLVVMVVLSSAVACDEIDYDENNESNTSQY